MCDRYDWDHEYFERMGMRWNRVCLEAYRAKHPGFKTMYEKTRDAEFVGAVIINMPEPNSNDDESIPGLHDRAMDDWSSVSSGDDDDSIHTNGEMTGWKHKSLLEIIRQWSTSWHPKKKECC